MKTKVGLWIDHKKAVIVALTGEGEHIELVISNVEKQMRRTGNMPLNTPFEALKVPADDVCQKNFTKKLDAYYDAVIASICDAESILIFGPGEAKGQLKKRLETKKLEGRITSVETVDKMTKSQIAAKVHQYFAKRQQAIS